MSIPRSIGSKGDLKYAEHKYLYRNLRNGRFEEVTSQGGPGILENAPARGCAFGDYNNDGVMDVAVNCINCHSPIAAWRFDAESQLDQDQTRRSQVESHGHRQPRQSDCHHNAGSHEAIAADEELRSGGSYFSQNDLRLHFGLDQAKKVDMVEIRWLSGHVDQIKDLAVNQLHVIQEGGKF
jgi:hypothetical protein